MTFIYMWYCCIFTSLHCEDYSKDYEDDDGNSMIFLFLWCQSWWWGKCAFIGERGWYWSLKKKTWAKGSHRCIEWTRLKEQLTWEQVFYDYDYYHFLKEQLTCEQVTTYCETLSEFFKTFKFQFWTSPQNAFPKTHRCEELSRTRTCRGPGGSTPDHFQLRFLAYDVNHESAFKDTQTCHGPGRSKPDVSISYSIHMM